MNKKLTQIAMATALVMGGAMSAHAANDPVVTFTGHIQKATCNLKVSGGGAIDFGSFLQADMPAAAGVVPGTQKTVSINFDGCTGDAIPKDHSMVLKADAPMNSAKLNTEDLWGDDATGALNIGVALEATSGEQETAQPLTPTKNIVPVMAAAGASGEDPASLTIKPVMITANLKTTAAKASVKDGDINAAVIFSAAYQ